MKLVIPHIHRTLGDAGFFASISRKGEIKELRIKVLEGLRQVEGILIGRRIFETPLVISRVCGICPTSHILNACQALEKALEIKPSLQTDHLRKLITSAQIIQSHSAHIFFMSLADFFNIRDDLKLIKKFSRETKAVLQLRDFALSIIKLVGGRTVHPMTPVVGGFSKIPEKSGYKKVLESCKKARESSLVLINLFKNLEYPQLNPHTKQAQDVKSGKNKKSVLAPTPNFGVGARYGVGVKRETVFCSSFSKKEYPHYKGELIKIRGEVFSPGDFFSNQIEEDLKTPPAKRVKFQSKPYMLGAIARMNNNKDTLDPEAKFFLGEFQKKNNLKEEKFFENIFYNTFCQAVEILHFLKEIEKDLSELIKEKPEEPRKEFKISRGSGLGALEAPRGTLFSYFEIDDQGRISDCSIITPTAQFLRNLEEDLRVLLPDILKLSEKEKIKKVKTLIRAYDPCISCAVH